MTASRHLRCRQPSRWATRELSRIVTFYLQNVRRHDKREYIGIYRQMLRVIDKGVTTAQMAQAARNYAESEFVKAIPELRRHHIRRFFVAERIRRWAQHRENPQQRLLVALDRLACSALVADGVRRSRPRPTPIVDTDSR